MSLGQEIAACAHRSLFIHAKFYDDDDDDDDDGDGDGDGDCPRSKHPRESPALGPHWGSHFAELRRIKK